MDKLMDALDAGGGKARFDIGTFRIHVRKNGRVRLYKGENKGKYVLVNKYNTATFSPSSELKRRMKGKNYEFRPDFDKENPL